MLPHVFLRIFSEGPIGNYHGFQNEQKVIIRIFNTFRRTCTSIYNRDVLRKSQRISKLYFLKDQKTNNWGILRFLIIFLWRTVVDNIFCRIERDYYLELRFLKKKQSSNMDFKGFFLKDHRFFKIFNERLSADLKNIFFQDLHRFFQNIICETKSNNFEFFKYFVNDRNS